jgi:ribosome-associated translation inhibitor RaiA
MQIPLQITFHNLEPSEPLSEYIRGKVAKLEERFPRLVGCKVVVEEPNHHHRQGKGKHYRICVELAVPGETLVANRESPEITSHEDVHRAITTTFEAALRKLEAFSDGIDRHEKSHAPQKGRDRPWLKT